MRRNNDFAPGPDAVKRALEAIEEAGTQSIPGVTHLQTLKQAGIAPPIHVGAVTVHAFDVTHGRPEHGELRSDDHVSVYKVTAPNECRECGERGLTREYSAHHHISGRDILECGNCAETLRNEHWG